MKKINTSKTKITELFTQTFIISYYHNTHIFSGNYKKWVI